MKKFKEILRITKSILILIIVLLTVCLIHMNLNLRVDANEEINENEVEITNLNTTELIESIINKEINYIDFFSDTNIGISKFKTNNDYYKELLNRSNALDIIYEMLLNDKYDEEYKTRAELLMNIINGS